MSENHDATEQFLHNLPELKPGESFAFKCHPGISCFNACCGDLRLMLTPYDALRLRKGLGMPSKDFIQAHAEVSVMPGAGFPAMRLRMLDGRGRKCPFVRSSGCSVYPNRPAACRTYPLGRATRLDEEGRLVEQFFVVREDHCRGFEETTQWTNATWLQDQGLEPYNEANDRYMVLMAHWKEHSGGRPLDAKQVNMAFLALYQPDDFQRFLKDMGVFKRLDVDEERQAAVLADEEAALEFALDWLELLLLGESANLRKKG